MLFILSQATDKSEDPLHGAGQLADIRSSSHERALLPLCDEGSSGHKTGYARYEDVPQSLVCEPPGTAGYVPPRGTGTEGSASVPSPGRRARAVPAERDQPAEADVYANTLFTRQPGERLEQERADAPPSVRRHYADRQLRRLRVDEAVPTVVLGQEAQPCRADRPVLGDHP